MSDRPFKVPLWWRLYRFVRMNHAKWVSHSATANRLRPFQRCITHASRCSRYGATSVWTMARDTLKCIWIYNYSKSFICIEELSADSCCFTTEFYHSTVENPIFAMFSCFSTSQKTGRMKLEANFGFVGKPILTFLITVHWNNFDMSNGSRKNRQNIAKRDFRHRCQSLRRYVSRSRSRDTTKHFIPNESRSRNWPFKRDKNENCATNGAARFCDIYTYIHTYHRPLKIRTDGNHARVRELGCISFFAITLTNVVRSMPKLAWVISYSNKTILTSLVSLRFLFPVL